MDDTQVKVNNPQAQPQATPQPQTNQPATPQVQPAGTMLKEQGTPSTVEAGSEFIKPSETEPAITPEETEAGVEKVSEFPKPGEEQYKVGIKLNGEANPPPTELSDAVKLPMTEQEARQTIKTTGFNDSRHWLAVLVEKIFQQLGLMPKKL